jgi:hypothetical protein
VLRLAGHAGGGEEVEHDPAPLPPGEVERSAVGQLTGDLGCRGVEERGRRGLIGAGLGTGQHDEQPGEHEGDGEHHEGRDPPRPPVASSSATGETGALASVMPVPRRRRHPGPSGVGIDDGRVGRRADRRRHRIGGPAMTRAREHGEGRADRHQPPPIQSHRIIGFTNTWIDTSVSPGAAG